MSDSLTIYALKFALIAVLIPVAHSAVTSSDLRQPVISRYAGEAQSSEAEGLVRAIPISDDGLYHVDATAVGAQLRLLVDTGANTTILTHADAKRTGVDLKKLRFRSRLITANGGSSLSFTRIKNLEIAGRKYNNVRVAIFEKPGGVSLLGQDLIRSFRRFSISDDIMHLEA